MIIKNGNIILKDCIREKTDIKITDDTITAIGSFMPYENEKVIDASDCYVSAGLVDIHTHGGGGGDFMDLTDEAFENALHFHAINGTTALLTSSVTAPPEQIVDMINVTRRYMKKENPICRVLGAHIEGPYISLKNKGAQKDIYLRVPSRDDYSFILDNSDVVRNVTIASELDGAAEMTKKLVQAGITVSCGHDDGKKETLLPIIEAGMSNCTHWYCAMSTAQVRDGVRSVGLVELALIDERLTLELLADNHHLTPEMIKLAFRCKGADRLCVVSDCLRAGGKPADGKLYTLGPKTDSTAQKFIVSDGVARLTDGTRFAGSIQPIGKMVRNLVKDCDISVTDAFKTATITPAKIIGAENCVGLLEKGRKADIYIADKNLYPVCTIVNGNII